MISFRDDTETGIFEVRIDGDITDQDIQELSARLEHKLAREKYLYIIQEVGDVHSIEPSQVWEDLLRTIPGNQEGAGKAAILADHSWQTWFGEVLKPYVGLEVRVFKPEDAAWARRWLQGGLPIGGQSLGGPAGSAKQN